MRTTHGDHIPGTRLGSNPPTRPVRCGGIKQCPDCRREAAAINLRLIYYREETYDENTRIRVLDSLREAGIDEETARIALHAMENRGILFRERKL